MFPDDDLSRSDKIHSFMEAAIFLLLIAGGVCLGNLASVMIDEWRLGIVAAEWVE